jgi:hypothetical protein
MSTIEIEGQKVQLSTAPDGEITASSAAFAVYVVQQVTGGGGGGLTPLPLPAWVQYAWEADSGVTVNMSNEVTAWVCRLTGNTLAGTAFADLPLLTTYQGVPCIRTENTTPRVLVSDDISFTGPWGAAGWHCEPDDGASATSSAILDTDAAANRLFRLLGTNSTTTWQASVTNTGGTTNAATSPAVGTRKRWQMHAATYEVGTNTYKCWSEQNLAMAANSFSPAGTMKTSTRPVMFGARPSGFPYSSTVTPANMLTYGMYLKADGVITQTDVDEISAYIQRKRAIFLAAL